MSISLQFVVLGTHFRNKVNSVLDLIDFPTHDRDVLVSFKFFIGCKVWENLMVVVS